MAETLTAFAFTGQGYVKEGMGLRMRETSTGREMLEEIRGVLDNPTVIDCMNTGTVADLTSTNMAQLATYIRAAHDLRIKHPDAFHHYRDSHKATDEMATLTHYTLGHSLGEFTALYAAGVLSFADGLRLVNRRGQVMQEIIRENDDAELHTVMTALTGLKGGEEALGELCKEFMDDPERAIGSYVSIANYNGPLQQVIGGTVDGVEYVEANSKTMRTDRLKVPAAFHTKIFAGAVTQLETFMKNNITLHDPVVPVIHNRTAAAGTDTAKMIEDVSKQVKSPVLFTHSILFLGAQGVRNVEVFGPGADNVGTMIKKTDKSLNVLAQA